MGESDKRGGSAALKKAYRKAIAGYLREQDPLRKDMYLRASYAIKLDLARRIKFKGGKKSCFETLRRTYGHVKKLNAPLTPTHKQLEGGKS